MSFGRSYSAANFVFVRLSAILFAFAACCSSLVCSSSRIEYSSCNSSTLVCNCLLSVSSSCMLPSSSCILVLKESISPFFWVNNSPFCSVSCCCVCLRLCMCMQSPAVLYSLHEHAYVFSCENVR